MPAAVADGGRCDLPRFTLSARLDHLAHSGPSVPSPFPKAFEAIQVFIRSFLPRAQTTRVGKQQLCIKDGNKTTTLSFSLQWLQDFEVVQSGVQPVRYSNGIRDDVYFSIYAALGTQGFLPDVRIVDVLLNQDDRDWQNRVQCETRFSDEEAKELYLGLNELQASLRLTLKAGVELPEVRAELEVVETLTRFYGRVRHLNDPAARAESLSYLKAAALCRILRLSEQKAKTPSSRAKVAFDEKIYALVQQFWVAQPYNRIKLPPAIHDLVEQRKRSTHEAAPLPKHQPKFDVGPLLRTLDPRLNARWRGAWEALQSNNPDKVSQAANSMVEVVDQVIDRVRGTQEFKDYLDARFPAQTDVVIATRALISRLKETLHKVKHETNEQPPKVAQSLIHQAEWLIDLLLGGESA
jgi:hypothetical protein